MKEKVNQYNGIYQELLDYFGADIMNKLYEKYKGQSISFPIKLINPEWKKLQIQKDSANGASVKELAKKYEYTEQRTRVILNTVSKKDSKKI